MVKIIKNWFFSLDLILKIGGWAGFLLFGVLFLLFGKK
jgi:hypothetical protein